MNYLRLGTILRVLSTRGASSNNIDVEILLVGDEVPVFARLVNSNNSIYSPIDRTPCIVGCVNGPDNLWAWAINFDDVMRISQGQKVIFDKSGNKVYLRGEGGLLIQTVKGNIDITSAGEINIIGNINIQGNVVITGNLEVSGISNLQGTTTIENKPFLTHTHSGVTSGPNNTGGVV